MKVTVSIDEGVLDRAKELAGTKRTSAVIERALETLVEVESAKRLIALGGSDPRAATRPRNPVDAHR